MPILFGKNNTQHTPFWIWIRDKISKSMLIRGNAAICVAIHCGEDESELYARHFGNWQTATVPVLPSTIRIELDNRLLFIEFDRKKNFF
jgi:hypothetical protein